jgi:hypothetical protein
MPGNASLPSKPKRKHREVNHLKRCSKCGQLKSYKQYGSYPRNVDGLQSACDKCRSQQTLLLYYKKHPKRIMNHFTCKRLQIRDQ